MRLATWKQRGVDKVIDITGTPECRHEFGSAEKFGIIDILVSY